MDVKQWQLEHATDWLPVTGYGPWHPLVPKGYVIAACTLGGVNTGRPQRRYFVIPKEEYGRGESCVADPTRHEELFIEDEVAFYGLGLQGTFREA